MVRGCCGGCLPLRGGELTGEGGNLYSEELQILYASPYIIRMLKYEDEWVT